MSGDISGYLGLITSEHADKPNFMASVAASVQPFADALGVLNSLSAAFDIDNAIGAQLDVVGKWVGASRFVKTALAGVYFSFDIQNLGFDQGVIWAPGDPTTGLTALPDDIYLMLLKAKIAANQWDGTIPGAYAAWDDLLETYGIEILIQDNGDMTITLAMVGATGNPTFQELFTGGYLDLRPAGVRITGYLYPSADAPLFGFDVESTAISGFDVGAFGVSVIPTYQLLFTNNGALTTESGIALTIE